MQSKGTVRSLLQHHSSKASILQCSAFFTVHLSHPYMTTGKTIALTRWTFVGKVMSLLFNMLSMLVITFLPKSKCLLISWLQLPSAVILEPPKYICICMLKMTSLFAQISIPHLRDKYIYSFLYISLGEGNGSPLQCSCLENPRDGGAWWAPIYGGTQSWTRLK